MGAILCMHDIQLIYDFKDGCGSFGLISLHPEKLNDKEFDLIGVEIPSMM